jgi:hypothetical protein
VRESVRELQKKGEARKFRDTFVTFIAIGLFAWARYWFDYSRASTANELADTIVKVFFRGVEKYNTEE